MNISESTINEDWLAARPSVIRDVETYSSDAFNLAQATLQTHNISCPQLAIVTQLWESYRNDKGNDLLYANIEKLDHHIVSYLKSLHISDGEVSKLKQKLNSIIATLEAFQSIKPKTKELIDETRKVLVDEKKDCLMMINTLKSKDNSNLMDYGQVSTALNKVEDTVKNESQAQILIKNLKKHSI